MNITNTNNNTIYSYDDLTHKLAIIQGSIYIPIFCAGLANNFLTILIILFNRDMRTVTNCYLLNLAISDILPLIVSLPFEISFLPVEVPWGHFGCKFRALLAETSTNASILTISAFTIERYLAVCHPFRSSSLSTTRRAIKIQIFIWFIAILSSTPYFYLAKSLDHHCLFDENFQLFVIICFHISATFFFVLPAFILCLLYALMGQRLYNIGLLNEKIHCSKNTRKNSNSFPMDLQHIGCNDHHLEQQFRAIRHSSSPIFISAQQSRFRSGTFSSTGLSVHIQSMKKSAFKMLFAVVIAFIICYAPFHIQRLITSRLNVSQLTLIQQRSITIFYFISGIFYYIGSTVNPIFYHLFSRKYRLACIRTMQRIIHCKNYHHYHQSRRRHRRKNQNVQKNDQLPLTPPCLNQIPTIKITETIYRSPNKLNINGSIRKNKNCLTRLSLPVHISNRIR